jgi:hypothetical protein
MHGLGSVNVVRRHPGSFLLHARLGRNFHGHPRGGGPYLALPSSFRQELYDAHPGHREKDAPTQYHSQDPCGLHPLTDGHEPSSPPHSAFVHFQVEKRMAETHHTIFKHLLRMILLQHLDIHVVFHDTNTS